MNNRASISTDADLEQVVGGDYARIQHQAQKFLQPIRRRRRRSAKLNPFKLELQFPEPNNHKKAASVSGLYIAHFGCWHLRDMPAYRRNVCPWG